MDTIAWQDSFSVGNELMDDQHKKLIGMLNHMIDDRNNCPDPQALWELLAKMSEYAEEHFHDEEDYMEQINYSDLESHKQEHESFKAKVSGFAADVFVNDELVQQNRGCKINCVNGHRYVNL
ncbi:MAG: bacteriohemerythrin [Phycisphaerae bacterium]|nr:bacteriohemerythrin [Phycisphaerae bacterium]